MKSALIFAAAFVVAVETIMLGVFFIRAEQPAINSPNQAFDLAIGGGLIAFGVIATIASIVWGCIKIDEAIGSN